MLIVAALGGNALLRRGEAITGDNQRATVRIAAKALAPLAAKHQLVICHGGGPEVGLLALQGAAYARVESYPVDALVAQTEGMVGYMIEQELGNLLSPDRPIATVQTMVEIDPKDPGFKTPGKFVGPVYLRDEAEHLANAKGWTFRPEADKWRRVVASPEPKRIFELRSIKSLLERNTVVIAAGGGGMPAMHEKGSNRRVVGVECVIEKDLAAELLARELEADVFLMLTDAEAVCIDWGTPTQRPIRRASPAALAAMRFPAGSMGPKVDAACRFVTATRKPAGIGAVADAEKILEGKAGTTISVDVSGIDHGLGSGPRANAVA
jgi:carbamate kinase